MKITPKHQINKTKYGKIILTDVDGESMSFGSVKEAAKFLDVTVMALYKALRNRSMVRGCTVTSQPDVKGA